MSTLEIIGRWVPSKGVCLTGVWNVECSLQALRKEKKKAARNVSGRIRCASLDVSNVMVAVHEALLRVEKGLVVSDSRVGPSNSQASSMNMFGRLAHEIWTGPTPGVIIPQAPVARTIDGQQSTSVTGWGLNRLAAANKKKVLPLSGFVFLLVVESNHKPAVPCRFLDGPFVPRNHPQHTAPRMRQYNIERDGCIRKVVNAACVGAGLGPLLHSTRSRRCDHLQMGMRFFFLDLTASIMPCATCPRVPDSANAVICNVVAAA